MFRRGVSLPRFFVVSREKIHPCKTLSANALKNILKKVSKRFGSNDILYISLQRITIHNKSKQ